MNIIINIIGPIVLIAFVAGMVTRPYLYFRDLSSGAIKKDPIHLCLFQGFVFGVIAIALGTSLKLDKFLSIIAVVALCLVSGTNLFFGIRAWLWDTNKKTVEPRN